MSYTIEKLSGLIDAKRIGNKETAIDWLLTDSRSLCFPEETLFFALRTERNTGACYIPELYKRGVRNFVIRCHPLSEEPVDIAPTDFSDSNFLLVPDPLKALQKLAKLHRNCFHIPIIGITGSNGKTVVKEWLYQLLAPGHTVVRSPRSYNSQIGVPLS
ncbi:Alanine racemase 1, partial [termite gut metagenome]